VVEISESIKDSAAQEYGEPPYGHAELSTLKTFTSKMGFDLAHSIERLGKAGVRLENEEQTIQQIAKLNKISPQQVYLTMKPAERAGMTKKLPITPEPGFGKRSLADICKEYDLNIQTILRDFADNNIKATPQMNIKKIAEQKDISPHYLYEFIKKTAEALSQSPETEDMRSVENKETRQNVVDMRLRKTSSAKGVSN